MLLESLKLIYKADVLFCTPVPLVFSPLDAVELSDEVTKTAPSSSGVATERLTVNFPVPLSPYRVSLFL